MDDFEVAPGIRIAGEQIERIIRAGIDPQQLRETLDISNFTDEQLIAVLTADGTAHGNR